jgi:hypothetical protein
MSVLRVMFLTLALFAAGCSEQSVEQSDLPLLLRAGELKGYGVNIHEHERYESFRKTRYFDGSMDVDYEFQTPEDAPEPLYLSVTVTFERTVRDAKASYLVQRGAAVVGGKIGGIETETLQDFFDYGDDSYFGLLKGEKGPVGNVFGTRVGRKVYFTFLAGVYFDDPQGWAEWVTPKLDYMKGYNPPPTSLLGLF